jgi:hypothetical protein
MATDHPMQWSAACSTQPWKGGGKFSQVLMVQSSRFIESAPRNAEKSSPSSGAISTLSEVFLQNHASPSGQRTTRKPKSGMNWLIPQAHSSAKLWSHQTAKPSVK